MKFLDPVPPEGDRSPSPGVHSLEEVYRAAGSLSRGDLQRLRGSARTLLEGFRIDRERYKPHDLVSEALTRSLDGGRRWKRGVDFDRHLVWVMRSIASAWRRKAVRTARAGATEMRETQLRAQQLHLFGEDGGASPIPDVPSREPGADSRLIAREQVDAIVRHFADDAAATEVIACLGLGMTGPEIQERTGMSRREFVRTIDRIRYFARRGGRRNAR